MAGSDPIQCLCIKSGIAINEGMRTNSHLNRGSQGSCACEGRDA